MAVLAEDLKECERKLKIASDAGLNLAKENESLKLQLQISHREDVSLRARINLLERELNNVQYTEVPAELRNNLKAFQLNIVRKLEQDRAQLTSKNEALNNELLSFQEYIHASLVKSENEQNRLQKDLDHWRSTAETLQKQLKEVQDLNIQ